jgi:succinate dehydrogenase / fumarate reductase cytochrome b subunit
MADNPQTRPARARPLSPHLTIYRWPAAMITSITHRATGLAMAVGLLVLAWWLVSISNGPESYGVFTMVMGSPIGILILFGFTWSLCFHFFSGIRHLSWDMGYGFSKPVARRASIWVIVLSIVAAIVIFACVWSGHGGYLR